MYAPFIGCEFHSGEKNKMLAKKWFSPLTKLEILLLRGGQKRLHRQKHPFMYFVGISESAVLTNIMEVKLEKQMGSQRGKKYPEGYEPFEASYGTEMLCLKTMTIPAPRLKLCPGRSNPIPTPRIDFERKAACVFNPDWRTEAFHILKAEAEVFEIKHRIRRHAAKSHATLDLALSLMAYGGSIPLSSSPDDRFEAYLCLRSPEFLRDLLALLDMPDSLHGPIAPELPKAA
jgi:hypothetical protein